MAHTWPQLRARFDGNVEAALHLVGDTEALWLTSHPTSHVRQQLKVGQLEALYEAMFLRIFGYWESLLEEVTLHWMARYSSSTYTPVAAAGTSLFLTLTDARPHLYFEHNQQRDYLLWHHPATVEMRLKRHLLSSPIEALCNQHSVVLGNYAAIRHHIAHGSADTRARFMASSVALTGSHFNGRPGKLLRSANFADPLNQPKWIRCITDSLKTFALTVAG